MFSFINSALAIPVLLFLGTDQLPTQPITETADLNPHQQVVRLHTSAETLVVPEKWELYGNGSFNGELTFELHFTAQYRKATFDVLWWPNRTEGTYGTWRHNLVSSEASLHRVCDYRIVANGIYT